VQRRVESAMQSSAEGAAQCRAEQCHGLLSEARRMDKEREQRKGGESAPSKAARRCAPSESLRPGAARAPRRTRPAAPSGPVEAPWRPPPLGARRGRWGASRLSYRRRWFCPRPGWHRSGHRSRRRRPNPARGPPLAGRHRPPLAPRTMDALLLPRAVGQGAGRGRGEQSSSATPAMATSAFSAPAGSPAAPEKSLASL